MQTTTPKSANGLLRQLVKGRACDRCRLPYIPGLVRLPNLIMLVISTNQVTAVGNFRGDELIRLDLTVQIEIHHPLDLDTGLSI